MWKTNNFINDSNEEKERLWHYLALKKISTLWREITSKHGDFYWLNCLHSLGTENKLKSPQKVCKNRDFCGIVMQSEKDKIFLSIYEVW